MEVVIYRGLPGAGKNWHAAQLGKDGKQVVVCCADDEHMVNNKYEFKLQNIGRAHKMCRMKFMRELFDDCLTDQRADYLVVANTNLSAWECASYYEVAAAYGGPTKIVTLWCSLELSVKRNTHGVPLNTLVAMYQTLLSEKLPSHWNHEIVLVEGKE